MDTVLYGTMPEADKAEYAAMYREPGALTAALNIYRAIGEQLDQSFEQPTTQPVLYIYGTDDVPAYVKPEVQARLPSFIEGPFESVSLKAGHWLIQEQTDVVVDRLMEHLVQHSQ